MRIRGENETYCFVGAQTRGRFAVLVPAGPSGWAEKALALHLDVPLLAPDPATAALYGSRSGAKQALREADVCVPARPRGAST